MKAWFLALGVVLAGVSGAAEVMPNTLPDTHGELKRESATCSALLRFSEEKEAGKAGGDDPFGGAIQPFETHYGTALCRVDATAKTAPGSGPMKVIVPPSAGPDIVLVLADVLDRVAAERGSWPRDVTVRVTTELPKGRDLIWEHTFHHTLGLLVASMIDGREIARNVVVGDFDIDAQASSFTARSDDGQLLQKVLGKRVKPVRLVALNFGSPRLGDLALDAGWQSLCQVQVLGAKSLEDTLRLATAKKGDALGDAIAGLDETNAVLAKRGGEMLKNPHVAKRLDAALAAWPDNHSAAAYSRMAAEGLPKHYSPDAIWLTVYSGVRELENPFIGNDEAAGQREKLNAGLKRFERKVDPAGAAVIALYRKAIDAASGRGGGDLRASIKAAEDAASSLREKG